MKEFIKQNGMLIDFAYFEENLDMFINEMEKGLAGENSSLKMLPTYISIDDIPEKRDSVIVIDAGGTNLRIALVNFDYSAPSISYFMRYPMLGTKGPITKDEFFSTLAEYLVPLTGKSKKIGFCFSFPADIVPNRDGRVIYLSKEVKIDGIENSLLGEPLKNSLAEKGFDIENIVILNDTVASLLGAKAVYGSRVFDSYTGFILGTGTNSCYIENNFNILKSEYLKNKPGNCIINIESAGYAKAPRTPVDDSFDSLTEKPGEQLFEKMISGAYQGGLLLEFIRAAVANGCFSKSFEEKLAAVSSLESKEIDDFCYYPYGDNKLAHLSKDNEKDLVSLYELVDAFFERAAVLSVVNLAAILKKTGTGKNPCRPVCISAEGSTFYKCKLLNEKINYYMIEFVRRRLGMYCEFVKAENSTLYGTALAGLLD
ncbi:MAG: hexokinase [Clostridiaceae bacterium]|jgi:hexokinase|nr:hexokinase [Clostridiaceae bacterium]